MSLKLSNKPLDNLETNSVNTRNKIRAEVARSRGNQWMVSSYESWQKRAPLGSSQDRNTSSVLRLVYRVI